MRLHLLIHTSPTASTFFESDGDSFIIGRNPAGEIHFGDTPVDGVSWKHARIDCREGEFVLRDLGSTNGTFLNGRRLTEPTRIHMGDQIGLGHKGPRLIVRQIGDHDATCLEVSAPIWHVGKGSDIADSAAPAGSLVGATRMMLRDMHDRFGQMQKRNRRLMVGAALLIATAICTTAAVLWAGHAHHAQAQQELRQQLEAEAAHRQAKELELEKQAAETKALAEKTGQMVAQLENNKTTIARSNSEAVYFVISTRGREMMTGTAFAVAASGTFATNAHIATPVRANLAAGGKAWLVSQGGERMYAIAKATPHADYHGDPHGPDVGLLMATLPAGETVPTVVELASPEELRELGPGAPLLYIGFPVFNEDGSDYRGSMSKVFARVFTGTLNRLMTFTGERGEFASEQWLEHDITSWHGASGSPVFNHHGKVVALINSGSSVQGIQSARNPNKGAVRVDLLQELMAQSNR